MTIVLWLVGIAAGLVILYLVGYFVLCVFGAWMGYKLYRRLPKRGVRKDEKEKWFLKLRKWFLKWLPKSKRVKKERSKV